ncbi:hypothetical protein LRR80_02971 [Streptomyces sp. RO-S4]|nr:hypothetical protein [Streptomyces sp. RO-S4]
MSGLTLTGPGRPTTLDGPERVGHNRRRPCSAPVSLRLREDLRKRGEIEGAVDKPRTLNSKLKYMIPRTGGQKTAIG